MIPFSHVDGRIDDTKAGTAVPVVLTGIGVPSSNS
jgi:hypothetical protein